MAASLAIREEGPGGHTPGPNLVLAILVGEGVVSRPKWRAVRLGLGTGNLLWTLCESLMGKGTLEANRGLNTTLSLCFYSSV